MVRRPHHVSGPVRAGRVHEPVRCRGRGVHPAHRLGPDRRCRGHRPGHGQCRGQTGQRSCRRRPDNIDAGRHLPGDDLPVHEHPDVPQPAGPTQSGHPQIRRRHRAGARLGPTGLRHDRPRKAPGPGGDTGPAHRLAVPQGPGRHVRAGHGRPDPGAPGPGPVSEQPFVRKDGLCHCQGCRAPGRGRSADHRPHRFARPVRTST